MSSLTFFEKSVLERLLRMSSGYVLDLSTGAFRDLFFDVGVKIYTEKYSQEGNSGPDRLRAFWRLENDHLVGAVIQSLLYYMLGSPYWAEGVGKNDENQCRVIIEWLLGSNGNGALVVKPVVPSKFDTAHINEQTHRMNQAIEGGDVSLGLGGAKDLVESCCRTILEERGVPIPKGITLPQLSKRTLKELKLAPGDIPEQLRAIQAIRQVLHNLAGLTGGIAELRNLYGTGHGKPAQFKGLGPRHARLACNSAITFVNFLFETHQEQGAHIATNEQDQKKP